MLFKTIKNFLTYEPKDIEGFELLEGSNEGSDNESENQNDINITESISQSTANINKGMVSLCIDDNLNVIKKEFGIPDNSDIIIREFKIGRKINAFIVYVDAMVDKAYVSDFVLRQLMSKQNFDEFDIWEDSNSLVSYINDNVISANEISKLKDFASIIYDIVSGNTALFIDGCDQSLCISSKGFEKREIEPPLTESVVLGSQEGFTENLRTNISLVRKIIRNKNLRTEMIKVGKTNQVFCAIMYLDGLTNNELINEVRRRITSIDTDFIAGAGALSEYIEDNSLMLLPQTLTTERPDRTASFIMEGKVAIIVEGTPFADIVPVAFYHLMQTSEDASLRWQYGSFLRIIRMVGIFTSTLVPALYIAITLFHQEAIPTELLLSISKSKEQVPFPTVLEVLLLEISFELIREGGIRVPGMIGQTLGIVGALILGQAAVSARLVSPILIIVVAITGLGSFAIPNYSLGIGLRILRFIFIFAAAELGLYGISLAIFVLGCIICNMKSFGIPFLSPVAPKTKSPPDIIIRQPVWKQGERTDLLQTQNRRRQGEPSRRWKRGSKGGGNP